MIALVANPKMPGFSQEVGKERVLCQVLCEHLELGRRDRRSRGAGSLHFRGLVLIRRKVHCLPRKRNIQMPDSPGSEVDEKSGNRFHLLVDTMSERA